MSNKELANMLTGARDPLGGKEGYGGFSYYKNSLVDEVRTRLESSGIRLDNAVSKLEEAMMSTNPWPLIQDALTILREVEG